MKRIGYINTSIATLLLMADAAEGVDPLDTNVNDIDTSYPRIPAKVYDLKIASAKKEPTKDGTGERLTIVLETQEEVTSTEGEPLQPGHKLTHYIGITELPERPSKDGSKTLRPYTAQDIAKAVAPIAKAAGLAVTVRSIIDNPAQLDGKTVLTKVKVSPETNEWPEANRIQDFVVRR